MGNVGNLGDGAFYESDESSPVVSTDVFFDPFFETLAVPLLETLFNLDHVFLTPGDHNSSQHVLLGAHARHGVVQPNREVIGSVSRT